MFIKIMFYLIYWMKNTLDWFIFEKWQLKLHDVGEPGASDVVAASDHAWSLNSLQMAIVQ